MPICIYYRYGLSYLQSKLLVDTATRTPGGSDELIDISELTAGDILTLTRSVNLIMNLRPTLIKVAFKTILCIIWFKLILMKQIYTLVNMFSPCILLLCDRINLYCDSSIFSFFIVRKANLFLSKAVKKKRVIVLKYTKINTLV